MNPALFTSTSQNWGTPRPFLNGLLSSLNVQLGLDTCARNPTEAVVPLFYTPKQNGLYNTWKNPLVAWCNPPYSTIDDWAYKAFEEHTKHDQEILFLAPSRTDTLWYKRLALISNCIYKVHGRLDFVDLDGYSEKPIGAPFPSCVFHIKKPYTNTYRFIDTLGKLWT